MFIESKSFFFLRVELKKKTFIDRDTTLSPPKSNDSAKEVEHFFFVVGSRSVSGDTSFDLLAINFFFNRLLIISGVNNDWFYGGIFMPNSSN